MIHTVTSAKSTSIPGAVDTIQIPSFLMRCAVCAAVDTQIQHLPVTPLNAAKERYNQQNQISASVSAISC